MADVFEDTASRLWWGVRRFFWVLLITVPVAALLFVSAGASGFGSQYRATALVIAAQQPLPIDAYAKLAENVFSSGAVAERAVNEGRLSIKPSSLIPEHAQLEPVEENIVFRVVGIHSERRLAADIANAVAVAFTAELNRAGEGVGTFRVQDIARVPDAASDAVAAAPVLLVLGAAMGLLVGTAFVGIFLTLRRPVLGAEEASALVGAPTAGTPTLPAIRGLPPESSEVPGLAATVKRLFPEPEGTIVLIAPAGDEEIRTVVAHLLAQTLGRQRRTILVPSRDEAVKPLYTGVESDARVMVAKTLPDPSTWNRAPVVIDGPSAKGSDAPQMIPETARIVVVIRQGSPRTRVLDIASQFLPGEISALVFVRRGNVWPWPVSPRTAPVPDAPLPVSGPAPTVPTRAAETSRPMPAAWTPADEPELLVEEPRVPSMPSAGRQASPGQPHRSHRAPRPPREINLNDLTDAPPPERHAKQDGPAPVDGESVSPRKPVE